jgi:hypothetical protein
MSNIKDDINAITKEFITVKVHECAMESPELEELTFFKQIVEIDGGRYLLHFHHLEGNKIRLKTDIPTSKKSSVRNSFSVYFADLLAKLRS